MGLGLALFPITDGPCVDVHTLCGVFLVQPEVQPPRPDIITQCSNLSRIFGRFWPKCLKNQGWQHVNEPLPLRLSG